MAANVRSAVNGEHTAAGFVVSNVGVVFTVTVTAVVSEQLADVTPTI